MPRRKVTWAERVVQFRAARGWTQARAATWYGVSPRQWQRWESGETPVPVRVQLWLARSRLPPKAATQ